MMLVDWATPSQFEEAWRHVHKGLNTPICEHYPSGRRYFYRTFIPFELNLPPHARVEFRKGEEYSAVQTLNGSTAYRDTYIVTVPFDVEHKGGNLYHAKNPIL